MKPTFHARFCSGGGTGDCLADHTGRIRLTIVMLVILIAAIIYSDTPPTRTGHNKYSGDQHSECPLVKQTSVFRTYNIDQMGFAVSTIFLVKKVSKEIKVKIHCRWNVFLTDFVLGLPIILWGFRKCSSQFLIADPPSPSYCQLRRPYSPYEPHCRTCPAVSKAY